MKNKKYIYIYIYIYTYRERERERKHTLKKNNHMHKTIFTWFGNLPTSTKLQGFYYYQGKIQSAATMFFSLSRNTTNNKL